MDGQVEVETASTGDSSDDDDGRDDGGDGRVGLKTAVSLIYPPRRWRLRHGLWPPDVPGIQRGPARQTTQEEAPAKLQRGWGASHDHRQDEQAAETLSINTTM